MGVLAAIMQLILIIGVILVAISITKSNCQTNVISERQTSNPSIHRTDGSMMPIQNTINSNIANFNIPASFQKNQNLLTDTFYSMFNEPSPWLTAFDSYQRRKDYDRYLLQTSNK